VADTQSHRAAFALVLLAVCLGLRRYQRCGRSAPNKPLKSGSTAQRSRSRS
jgi:hypothetical protein